MKTPPLPRGHECGPYCHDRRHAEVAFGPVGLSEARRCFDDDLARFGWRCADVMLAPEMPRPTHAYRAADLASYLPVPEEFLGYLVIMEPAVPHD